MFQNIPDELKELKQFVCWRSEIRSGDKPTKVPYNPVGGYRASVKKRDHWVSFEDAVKHADNYDGIGFVLSDDDPYTFVDFDDTKGDSELLNNHKKLVSELDSYTELSPSGNGVHVIVKSNVDVGKRRKELEIEVYSTERYMTMTGNIFLKKPIEYRHEVIRELRETMTSVSTNIDFEGSSEQVISDEKLIDIASNAANGEFFSELFNGNFHTYYSSQSEADMSLINMIGFYTENIEQVIRIFRMSALGQRAKADRDNYVRPMAEKSFDQKLPTIDFEGLKNNMKKALENTNLKSEKIEKNNSIIEAQRIFAKQNSIELSTEIVNVELTPNTIYSFPDGLLGEFAQYTYNTAPRPVEEIALAGAIGFLSGICGRCYQVSGTGLNQYTLLLAQTGRGKEAMILAIDRLVNQVESRFPEKFQNFIGPVSIASGQALNKYFRTNNSFVSIVGEFGYTMEELTDKRAAPAKKALMAEFLSIYTKSAKGAILGITAYADADKNTTPVKSPAFSLLGETVPSKFYDSINESNFSSGFIPRMTIIEFNGKRPKSNPNMNQEPTESLVNKFADLFRMCTDMNKNDRTCEVKQDKFAAKRLVEIDNYCDKLMNGDIKIEAINDLWNRGHLTTLKLAALLAVSSNMYEPVINLQQVNWAWDVVRTSKERIAERFSTGDIGIQSDEKVQMDLVRKFMIEYFSNGVQKARRTLNINKQMYEDMIIPHSYLSRKTANYNVFTSDRTGAKKALNKIIDTMIDREYLTRMSAVDMFKNYDTRAIGYAILDPSILTLI